MLHLTPRQVYARVFHLRKVQEAQRWPLEWQLGHLNALLVNLFRDKHAEPVTTEGCMPSEWARLRSQSSSAEMEKAKIEMLRTQMMALAQRK